MNLNQWLTKLESAHHKKIDLGLERITTVASHLGVLKYQCPIITVAGTNGKGSVCAALESIYTTAGFKTGLYTSPHLINYNERIKIQNQPVTDELICQAFDKITTARQEISLSYFEYATLAALIIFQQAALDVIILEVGLGGRLDASNCIDPDLAIITSIDLDHQNWLGNTREQIALEKAGIMRQEIPAICGDANPPQTLIDQAKKLKAKLFIQQRDFDIANYPNIPIRQDNAATATAAINCLQTRLPVPNQAIEQGLQQIKLIGRCQIVPGEVTTLFDVAHNPAAITHLIQQLTKIKNKGRVHAVFSMLGDKDFSSCINLLKASVDQWYLAPLHCERAVTVEALQSALNEQSVKTFNSIQRAYQSAQNQAEKGDIIVVAGSFYTVAQALEFCV